MKTRLRFARLATLTGWRWLAGMATAFGAVVILLGAVGVSVVTAVTLPHWWLSLVVAGGLYAILFTEGSYQVWRDAHARVGEIERKIAELETAPRPHLSFREPEVAEAGVVVSALQPTGTTVLLRPPNVSYYFARVNIVNDPPAGSRGATAEQVTASIEFRTDDGSYPVKMMGRWAETLQRGETGRLGINLQEAQLDIVPNGLSHPVDIIMKDPGDNVCFAYNHENSTAMDLKLPKHELTEAQYLVRVTLRGANVEPISADYVLFANAGVPPQLRGPYDRQDFAGE